MNKKEMTEILINGGIDENEARAEIDLLLEFSLNKTREEIIFIKEFPDFSDILNERAKKRIPIQYLLGFAPFMGEKFKVNKNVLIPRDETEILVKSAFSFVKDKSKILDIGTGSGIIACMLGKLSKINNLDVEIIGVDISSDALNVAIDNMKHLNLIRHVMFRKSDLFSNIREDEKFDIIVSNPPYIPVNMKDNIQKEVLYEPDIALYTFDEDGLYFYKKIISDAPNFLKKGGKLLFEMMKGQSNFIKDIMKKNGYVDIEITKDLSGIERVISASFFD